MPRTNPTAVRAVIEVDTRYESSLTSAIARAHKLTNHIANKDTTGTLEAVDLLEDIETLLAAHYYSLRDPQYKSRSVGQASGVFNERDWWKEAQNLDITGTLASMVAGNKKAGIIWLGMTETEQTDYWDRN